MTPVNVLVVFYSRYGTAEQLALAAGVGAIQAQGNIRLRRVADLADESTIRSSPAWQQNLDRMNRDYVRPRPADPQWADVIVLATPGGSSRELEEYIASLPSIGVMAGKIAAPLAPGNSETALKPIYAVAASVGFLVAPIQVGADDPVASARAKAKRIAQIARVLKDAGYAS